MNKFIVISLIGIPASGKTSLAKKIVEWSKNDMIESGVVRISFDDHLNLNYGELSEGDYKKSREELLWKIEKLVKGEVTNFNIQYLKQYVSNLIIIDDTMHFRSMRQRIRALSRICNCEYFQIFIECQLEVALMRNSQRDCKVPSSVITKLNEILEKPINPRTIKVDLTTTDEELLTLLRDRIKSPENLEIFVREKLQQQQSLIHEADLITRKQLSAKILSLKSHPNLSKISADLNRKRKQFLDDLRTMKTYADDVDSSQSLFEKYLILS
jgi:tRNA uridine 5-carbamoylmethylation protein Kti12